MVLIAALSLAMLAGVLLSRSNVKPVQGEHSQVVTGATGVVWAADWVHGGKDIAGTSAAATVIVRARVKSIREGESLKTPSAQDVAPLPTQVIGFETLKAIKGSPGTTFELFKTGTQTKWLEDDPAYQLGETYLLFLEKRPDGRFIPLGPDGRMKLGGDGSLKVQSDGPISRQLTKPATDDLTEVETAAKGGN